MMCDDSQFHESYETNEYMTWVKGFFLPFFSQTLRRLLCNYVVR